MSARSLNGSRPTPCPVVAIGASAGGLDACRRLLDGIAADTGHAFLIVQHLDPSHDSLLVELLASHTAMAVVEATDGAIIAPNHVYVIAACHGADGRQRPAERRPAQKRRMARGCLRRLLRSLAAADAAHCTAIVLSGTGGDGSAGLTPFHAAGGRVIAQDPAEAAYAGMPDAAIATGEVDRVCRIVDMPAALAETTSMVPVPATPANASAWLTAIIELLRTTTAHDFTLYKTGTLQRRIERRMAMAAIKPDDCDRYLDRLRERSEPNVRAAGQGPADQRHQLLPRPDGVRRTSPTRSSRTWCATRPPDQPIRIWVAGCSTGEETYSLAMLFREAIAAAKRGIRLQVFASDVDADAVATARDGLYPETIEADVSPDRLARFFTREDDGYRVSPELRAVGGVHGAGRAGRSAVLPPRYGLVPQPADLSAARSAGEGRRAVPFRAARGRRPAARQLRDRRRRRRPLRGDLQGGAALSPRRPQPAGRIRLPHAAPTARAVRRGRSATRRRRRARPRSPNCAAGWCSRPMRPPRS